MKKIYTLCMFFTVFIIYSQNKESINELLIPIDSLYKQAIGINNDSLKNIALKKYMKLYYRHREWDSLQKVRLKHLALTYISKDTISRGRNYEYAAAYYKKTHNIDSTFYYYNKSYKVYESINDSLDAGYMLLNMAVLQKNMRDYSGSEYKSLKSEIYLQGRVKPRRLASIYNNIAVIYDNLKKYDASLNYHLKALQLRKEEVKDSIYIIHSLNNIGDFYIGQKKYIQALFYLKKAISYKNLDIKSKLYAIVLDNYSYTRFKLGELETIEEDLLQSLKIKKDKEDIYGLANTYLHLAEYYKEKGQKSIAILNAEKGVKIAKESKNFQGYLKLMNFLGNIYDGKKSKQTFNTLDYIRDSLEIADKRQRDSFASIELQLDQKNQIIDDKRNTIKARYQAIVVLTALLLLVMIFYILFYRKSKKQLVKVEKKLSEVALDNIDDVDERFSIFHKELMNTYKEYGMTEIMLEYWVLRGQRKTIEQIAERLHKSVNTIKGRRKRLIKVLKKATGKEDIPKSFLLDLYDKELQCFLKKESKKRKESPE